MKSKNTVKFLIVLIIISAVSLLALIGFQLIKIHKAKRKISAQQYQIEQYQKVLDYYQNQLPDGEFETIIGED